MHAVETESFLINRDSKWGAWVITPLTVSEAWVALMGGIDWDMLWSSNQDLAPMYARFKMLWEQAWMVTGHDILICEPEITYVFGVLPGAHALRPGKQSWSDATEVWTLTGLSTRLGLAASQPQFIKGIVRTINMVRIDERNHVGERTRAVSNLL